MGKYGSIFPLFVCNNNHRLGCFVFVCLFVSLQPNNNALAPQKEPEPEAEAELKVESETPAVERRAPTGPWDYTLLSGLTSCVSRDPCLVPDDPEGLPPLLIATGDDEGGGTNDQGPPPPIRPRS